MAQYFMGGVNASGKSTLAREISSVKPEFEVIHTGAAIMERLGIAPGDIDTLRALPEVDKRRENEAMLSELTRRSLGRSALYDSHYLNMIEGKVTRLIIGRGPFDLDGLLLVEAKPEVLYERIKRDAPTKNRRLFPHDVTPARALDILNVYTRRTREECNRLAKTFNLPTLILQNDTDQLDNAVEQFIEFDEQIRQGSSKDTLETFNVEVRPEVKLAQQVSERLLAANIDFCVFSGSHAALIGGHRTTQDIDFWADNQKWDQLISVFPEAHITDRRTAWQPGQPYDGVLLTLGDRKEVGIMAGTIIHADGVTYPSSFTNLVREHRNWSTLGGLTTWFADPADTLLFKAIMQRGKEVNKNDLDDIIAIRDNVTLDVSYLLARIKECDAGQRVLPLLFELGVLASQEI
jgi:hypothetical protein